MRLKESNVQVVGAGSSRSGSVSPVRRGEEHTRGYLSFRVFFGFGLLLLTAMSLSAASCASNESRGHEKTAAGPTATDEATARRTRADTTDDDAAIRRLLATQAEAWNRRDLVGFMAGYWESEDLVFMTTEGSTRGHAETLARYRKNYDVPEKFGRLAFEELDVSPVDHETAVVRGVWRLKDRTGEPHGRFVLIVRRFPTGWKVVSDYTTSG